MSRLRPSVIGGTCRASPPRGEDDKGEHMRAFDVYLRGKLIDTVFYSTGAVVDADEVKRSLVNHDGYDPAITVRERRRGRS